MFHRDQTSKDTLNLRVGQRAGRSWLEGTEIDVQRRDSRNFEVSPNHSQAFGRVQLDLGLGHRRGVPWFGAQADFPGAEGDRDRPTFQYRLHTLDVSLAMPLGALAYSANLRAQRSTTRLYATEYFSIGNRWPVLGVSASLHF